MRQSRRGFLATFAAIVMAVPALASEPLRVVALGDSLTAGYQLPPAASFPARLEVALRARGLDVIIENAGVSGDTATGGLARLDWAVPDGTSAVLVELGANDALRGIAPAETRAALDEMIARLKARGIAVMLLGMRAPPNMGTDYASAFDSIFPDLASKHGVPLYPFFLDGVAANPALNLADGMHPNPEGVDVIVERALPSIETFLRGLGPA